jgi:chromosome segregation ATPase
LAALGAKKKEMQEQMNAQLQQDVLQWSTKVEANRDKVLQMERTKVAGSVESRKLEMQLRALQQQDRELGGQYARLQQIVAQQQERLSREQSKHAEQQQGLRHELQQAEHQLQQRKGDCRRQAEAAHRTKQQLADMPDVWRAEAVTTKQQLATAQQARAAAELEHASLEAEVQQQSGLLRLQREDHDATLRRYNSEKRQAEAAVERDNARVVARTAQRDAQAAELAALAQEVATWTAEATERQQHLGSLREAAEAAQTQASALQRELRDNTAKAAEHAEQKSRLEQQLCTLQQQAAEYQAAAEQADAECAQLAAAPPPTMPSAGEQTAVREQEASIQALQLQNQALLRRNAETVEQLGALEQQAAQRRQAAQQVRNANATIQTDLQREQIRLEQLQAEQAELSQWYEQRNGLRQQAQQEVDLAQQEQGRLQTDQQLLEARLASARSRNTRMRQLCQVPRELPERQAQQLFAQLARHT